MKKKKIIATIGTLVASSIAFTAAFTGCSLVSANNAADMRQVIATVNISDAKGLSDSDSALITKYSKAVGTTKIYKNELVAFYLNTGVSYVNSGYPYSQVFNMLIDSLVENAVLTQYSVMYVLNKKAGPSASPAVILSDFNKMTYVEQLEYLLTDDESDDPDKEIKIAKYSLYSSLNNAIDSYEQRFLDDDDSTSGSGKRSTPTGVDVTVDDYYPVTEDGKLDYNVYTGYKGYQLADSGVYKDDALDGTNKITRMKAYHEFLSTLATNGLIDPYKDNLLKVTEGVEYFKAEYTKRLENRLINKYYDLYEKEKEEKLTDGGAYDYLDLAYRKMTRMQELDKDNFSSTFDKLSDTSFVLYSPDTEGEGTYGFVYNILLPFSATQSAKLTELQTKYADSKTEGGYKVGYYNERNKLLKQIKTTDQREAWFNGDTEYAFNASETELDYFGKGENRNYLFFENNLTKSSQYKALDKYDGRYSYNGKVYEKEEGGYQLIPAKLTIDDMLEEFTAYVNYVLGSDSASYTVNSNYYDELPSTYDSAASKNFWKDDEEKEVDYENFIYASGKVTLPASGTAFNGNLLTKEKGKESVQYKALSAVNELQYAYTTDTGVLSNYIGYNVTLGDTTGYIKEFETAAHLAIAEGAGAFNVCAGDYGWHLIYVTYTFDTVGAVYEPDWDNNVKIEGTFENLFYELIKNKDIAQISTTRRTQIMTQFNINNTTVKKYKSTYQDLLDLDS